MRIAICDDIPQVAQDLKNKIETICAKKDWPLQTKVYISPKTMLLEDLSAFQVIFLDIDMPEMNGLEVARHIRELNPEIVLVFVTAFIEYAPAGYHVSAFRYLLKQQISCELLSVMEDVQRKLFESAEIIEIHQKSEVLSVPLKDIVYIEGTPNRKTLFHIDNMNTPIEAIGKLADYEQALEGKGFLRLQKSFIANMSQIIKISNYQVYLRTGEVLKASEKYYKQVHSGFLQWKGRHL